MKKTIIALAAVAVALAALLAVTSTPVIAQPAIGSSILQPSRIVGANAWGTNRVAGSTAFLLATNSTAKIDTKGAGYLGVEFQGNLNGAGTTVFVMALSGTVGANTNRNIFGYVTNTANGATAVGTTGGFDVRTYSAVFLEYLTNYSGTGTSYVTNWFVDYGLK